MVQEGSDRRQPDVVSLCTCHVKGDRTNNRLKNSSTSSVVDGPPMFMKTIAVGPFEPVLSCVTGGTGVASVRTWLMTLLCHSEDVGVLVSLLKVD